MAFPFIVPLLQVFDLAHHRAGRFARQEVIMILRCTTVIFLVLMLSNSVLAQSQKLPPDIANLPEEIKSLQWQSIDPAAASNLERCRALLLLNHVLEEVSANSTSEADLMSSYIQSQNL